MISALSGAALAANGATAEVLGLYNWGDYINPEILRKLTEETGIDVGLDTYASNEEMLAKTDINQAADRGNIDPAFMNASSDPKGEYCMPSGWGTVDVFYNTEAAGGPITSWADFFAIPEKTGNKITMLNDMREVMAVGLIMNGTSVNATDPSEIEAAMEHLEMFTDLGAAVKQYDRAWNSIRTAD